MEDKCELICVEQERKFYRQIMPISRQYQFILLIYAKQHFAICRIC